MKTSGKKGIYIGSVLGALLLLVLDQWTKYLAITRLKGKASFQLIEGVFSFSYLENRGAAFGILQNQKWFFILANLLFLVFVVWCFKKMPEDKKYRWFRFVLVGISAGAVGNLLDRIRLGYVVDFLYFSLIDFPVFNVADCYVVVSAFAFIFLFLFYYKEEDLNFLPFFGETTKGNKHE